MASLSVGDQGWNGAGSRTAQRQRVPNSESAVDCTILGSEIFPSSWRVKFSLTEPVWFVLVAAWLFKLSQR